MMRVFLLFIFCACFTTTRAEVDSLRVEVQDDKQYIIHRVEEKETLYSISRRYDVPIYEIIKHNPPTEYGLDPGTLIRIPYKQKPEKVNEPEVIIQSGKVDAIVPPSPVDKVAKDKELIHVVEPKQTLFSISRMYQVTVADIKLWNNLMTNELDIGQELVIKLIEVSPEVKEEQGKVHVVQLSETLYAISKQYNLTIAELKSWNKLEGNEISVGQTLLLEPANQVIVSGEVMEEVDSIEEPMPVTAKEKEEIDTARYNIKPEKRTNFEEIVEDGLAEQIEGTSGNRKYLALHKSAKVGTIMKVRNEMNDQEVFVRVIGPLPQTSVNDNLVVKISEAAYNSLGAIDPRFRVTVSYIP